MLFHLTYTKLSGNTFQFTEIFTFYCCINDEYKRMKSMMWKSQQFLYTVYPDLRHLPAAPALPLPALTFDLPHLTRSAFICTCQTADRTETSPLPQINIYDLTQRPFPARNPAFTENLHRYSLYHFFHSGRSICQPQVPQQLRRLQQRISGRSWSSSLQS